MFILCYFAVGWKSTLIFWKEDAVCVGKLSLKSVVRKMVIAAHFSDFKNFIKLNNKIPHYARDYKKEYLFIIGLNYEFLYFIDNKDKISTYEYFHNDNVDRIIKLIKIFLKGQKKG